MGFLGFSFFFWFCLVGLGFRGLGVFGFLWGLGFRVFWGFGV